MLNQVNIQGRLVDDVKEGEIHHTPNGDLKVYKFKIASQKETGKKWTNFIPCEALGKTGEFIQKWFKKGYMGFFSGELTSKKDWSVSGGMDVVIFTVAHADFPTDRKDDDERPVEVIDEDIPF